MAMFEEMGDNITAKCLQKYLFIFTRLQNEERIYDFVPYKYGCFSFLANQDIVTLAKNGFLSIDKNTYSDCKYSLVAKMNCIQDLTMFDSILIKKIKKKFSGFSQDELIAYTYRKWPFTAINSVIKNYLLSKEELAIVEKQRRKFHKEDSALMTIGYEGMTLEKYLNMLITNDIHVLCDVRKNAFSMKYGFSKGILQKACEGVGIKYVHIPELGIVSEKRKTLNTQKDYDELFDQYEKTTLLENWNALLYVRNIIDEEKRVCLTCFEKNPKQCHRTRVAKALMGLPNIKYTYFPIVL